MKKPSVEKLTPAQQITLVRIIFAALMFVAIVVLLGIPIFRVLWKSSPVVGILSIGVFVFCLLTWLALFLGRGTAKSK